MKAHSFLLLPALLLLSLSCTALQAQQAISLQQHMGDAAFSQAGLDKLSPAELQHLQQWLAEHAPELVAAVPASDATSASVAAGKTVARTGGWFGLKGDTATAKNNDIVTSQLVGDFNGWQTGTTLTLQNGQKWRVVDDSSLTVRKPVASPEVTVKPGALSSWVLKVKGYNSSARVEPAN